MRTAPAGMSFYDPLPQNAKLPAQIVQNLSDTGSLYTVLFIHSYL